MAYLVGFATNEEVKELERRDWEVEDASTFDLVGEDGEPYHICANPPEGDRCILVFVGNSIFDIMDGPDWEKG